GTLLNWQEKAVGSAGSGQAVGVGEFGALRLGEGAKIATQIRLLESVDIDDPTDPWVTVAIPQVRVIDLMLLEGEGQIGQIHTLFQQKRNKDGQVERDVWVQVGDQIIPRRRAKVIPLIPFVCINQQAVGFKVEDPQLLGVAEINGSHYRTSADLENARFTLGHPQPWATGVTTSDTILAGAGMWTMESVDAKFGVLQVANEFASLENAMREKEEAMASEGARLLSRPAGAPERTATEATLDVVAERSVIATMADTTSEGMTEAATILQWWFEGIGDLATVRERVEISLDTDFETGKMDPDKALKWAQLHVMNQISRPVLAYQLRRGAVYPPGHTEEMELGLLEEEAPEGPMVTQDDATGASSGPGEQGGEDPDEQEDEDQDEQEDRGEDG
ncbi:MAG TPA: DUF4055 domain-containing protein, partial [Spirochaetia bacterium]|nr:DUF4055 domain-containing protein [Spirochaetia bacterium]